MTDKTKQGSAKGSSAGKNQTKDLQRFGVVGAGAWGTALAQLLASEGAPTALWAHESEVVAVINSRHENTLFLPGLPLSESIWASDDLGDLSDCDALLIVVPLVFLRGLLARIPKGDTPLILCSKGIEANSFALPVDMVAQLHPGRPLAVLSGPSFAHEVAAGLPTAVAIAATDMDLAMRLSAAIARPCFRPYPGDDLIGAGIGGAVKNVLAIACGIAEGAGFGENARAALITRGFTEMTRFGLMRGARFETLVGLSGLGDLVLTCSSAASRNFSLGVGLGRGETPEKLLSDRRTVAEGAHTAPVLALTARQNGLDMPIIYAVADLLGGHTSVRAVIDRLLDRPLSSESL